MTRKLDVGCAQLGPISRSDSRAEVVARLIALLEEGKERGCQLVVFPELALTTFFPRWWLDDQDEIDGFYERQMPSPETQPLFDRARELEVGFCIGYAELDESGPETRRFNTSILVGPDGRIIGKYRKVHLPGHSDQREDWDFQHLEKHYFDASDTGFPVWRAFGGILGMAICNDRRWPETYRVMGLQGVELVMIGYNTPIADPEVPHHDHLQSFHNHIVMQAGAYQNGTFVIAAAKCGQEEGSTMLGQSVIVAPTGEIVAQATSMGDELITARIDLDICADIKNYMFNFEMHRQPQHYGLIVERRGAVPPPLVDQGQG
ncbi:N-carbamoyl-D-amino-acid hydrolase [Microbacterium sp.]|uniref:N-carbamoyl-D-amino-acid hydrolase n=1 Tax=Microbacterium sp. TaxID=51671 RepID=UPI002811B24E|nr:N-carbamoyl-D-amino-acid hydrolase [Microbacterium sp.]